ncbi:MAG TPA: hypothetical protein VK469_15080, partial [Candidatus Kapabacteria bacterium]|nr:hypothetical protein [Candidatus Kapabacteria bacterium]
DNVFTSHSFYMLMDDMKWTELPGRVKEILDLCNGENLFKDIIESQGTSNKEFIETVLNQLFSLNILSD